MDAEKEIIELKGKLTMLEKRYSAMISLLCKEGIFTRRELKEEEKSVLEGEED